MDNRLQKELPVNILGRKTGERMPETLPADCLGEACPNFQGQECDSYEEWVTASATRTRFRDTSRPPFKDETEYIIYGQACVTEGRKEMVGQRAEVHMPERVDGMELAAITRMHGDMPVTIQTLGRTASTEAV